MSSAACAASQKRDGSADTVQSSATGGAGSGDVSKITRYRSVAETPSTMQ